MSFFTMVEKKCCVCEKWVKGIKMAFVRAGWKITEEGDICPDCQKIKEGGNKNEKSKKGRKR